MENNLFTREDTRAVKAVAAVMMMAHHLFAFAARRPTGHLYDTSVFPEGFLVNFGQFCSLCVALFLFVGGYGLYKQHTFGKCSLPRLLLRQYEHYWKVFIIFVPIGLLFFSNQPEYCSDASIYAAYANPTFQQFISELMGWSCKYNREWWYFRMYLLVTFIGLAYIGIVRRRYGFCPEALLVILLAIVNRMILNKPPSGTLLAMLKGNALYSSFVLIAPDQWANPFPFFMGIVFAKYDGIHRLREMFHQYAKGIRIIVSAFGLIVVYTARVHFLRNPFDLMLAPLFIVFWLELVQAVPLKLGKKVSRFIGSHSANIWLIHSFYCYYFHPAVKIVYWTTSPTITLLTLTVLTLASSVVLTWLYKLPDMISKKLKYAARVHP